MSRLTTKEISIKILKLVKSLFFKYNNFRDFFYILIRLLNLYHVHNTMKQYRFDIKTIIKMKVKDIKLKFMKIKYSNVVMMLKL